MRYNIFNKAHLPVKKALITGCFSFTELLSGHSSPACVLQKVQDVLNVFDEQTSYETVHILPFIFDYEPSVCSNYKSEHERLATLSVNLKLLVNTFYNGSKGGEKIEITAISELYNEFVLANFNHMDDEEAVLNEILWRYYPDSVLISLEEKIDILPHLVKTAQESGFRIATAA